MVLLIFYILSITAVEASEIIEHTVEKENFNIEFFHPPNDISIIEIIDFFYED